MHDLTILIPTRNRPDDLACTLSSILAEFGPGQKVLLGDNGDWDITSGVLGKFQDLDIVHIKNPPGNTYLRNLRHMIHLCESEWLSVMHDDDFFNRGFKADIEHHFKDPKTDFIFADHWICLGDGTIDEELTERNTKQYGRDLLKPGIQQNPGALAAGLRIALDGFFVRTSLAKSIPFDLSSPIFADNRWLIEICDSSKQTVYLDKRIFTYRVSDVSLTNTYPPIRSLLELGSALRKTKVKNKATKRALSKRKWRHNMSLIKLIIRQALLRMTSKRVRDI